MDNIQLFNDDCFNIFPTLEDKSINLFILDLPYGQTACHWDSVIDLDEMWKHIKRIMKPNALIVFFCTAKFGNTLINANPKWFKYDLIWKKSRKVGFLSANKMPLRQHENIYVFDNPVNEEYNDLELSRNKDLREYAEKVYKFIGKGLKAINKKLGHRRGEHFFYFKSSQFGLCTNETYNQLIKEYNINEMEGFLDYEILESLWEDAPPKIESTYNSQKTEGKPYKNGAIPNSDNVYGTAREKGTVTKTDRHPTSIIDHENIYVFNGNNDENEDLMNYSKKVLKHIGKTKSTIKKEIPMADHFFRYSKGNFSLPTKETYEKLIEIYNIDEMNDFIPFNKLEEKGTYNPQKTEGKPYKIKGGGEFDGVYGSMVRSKTENKGDRHPTSIIDHENIYVFDNTITDDIELSRNKDLREYAEKVYKFIGKGLKAINKKLGHRRVEHFFYFKSSQFGLCTNETYNQLIKEYNINEMGDYLEYDILESLWEGNPTYNPQKTEGKPYKTNEAELTNSYYRGGAKEYKTLGTENKGDRHPTSIINEIPEYEGDSILVYKNPHKTIHRTQKPVELLEWLIKTYSNEGDTVMDFTMGSGTCAVGCMNTKRKFIGVEMDKEIYDLAFDRIEKHKKNL